VAAVVVAAVADLAEAAVDAVVEAAALAVDLVVAHPVIPLMLRLKAAARN
jgi:hypothetical protein